MKYLVALGSMLVLLGSAGAPPVTARRSQSQEDVLDRKVKIAISDRETVEEVYVTMLRDAGAPGGIEVVSDCRQDRQYRLGDMYLPLRDALSTLVTADSGSRWEIRDGVVNFIRIDDPPALLSLPIIEF